MTIDGVYNFGGAMGNGKQTNVHESISIAEIKRERVIRQNRLELIGDKAYFNVGETLTEIFDCSPFGLALISKSLPINMDSLIEGSVLYQNRLVNKIRIKQIRHEALNDGTYKIACEVIGEPIDIEKMKAIKAANGLIKQNEILVDHVKNVPEGFKKLVYEMRDWLETLKKNVNNVDVKYELNKSDEYSEFENTVANIIGDYIVLNFEPQYKLLERELKKGSADQISASFEFFRNKMQELLLEAPFHNRAYNKPLGYAGDYQMMNQIYSFEGLGSNLFAKCLHLYFISAPESRAVRNRAVYLQQHITNLAKSVKSKPIKVLSVASGPAMEIQMFLRNNPKLSERYEFHLLDQDVESLQHAQRMIKHVERDCNIKANCVFMNKAIKNIIAGGLKETDYDLIYSAGLFDYFSDPVAQVAAQKLFNSIKPGGELIIGNFSTSSPGKITMDIALDWKLIYRSPEELKILFSHVGDTFNLQQEPEGINLFCHILKE